jgi:exopolysaccharide production protein ExoY
VIGFVSYPILAWLAFRFLNESRLAVSQVFLRDGCDQQEFGATLNDNQTWPTGAVTSPSNSQPLATGDIAPSRMGAATMSSDYLTSLGRELASPERVAPRFHASTVGGWSKRALDISIAAAALILLSPLFVMIGVLILLTLKRPILFSHVRIGHGGRLFRCYKFRTMVANADEVLKKHIESDKSAGEEWRATCKLVRDPRVTFFGRLLRVSSLDELPQLINIIRGDMSCVGPRPIVPDELKKYGESAEAYLKARPGLTGAWQVSGRSTLKYDDRVALDREYVENWSFWKDVRILFKTIPAVLRFEETS